MYKERYMHKYKLQQYLGRFLTKVFQTEIKNKTTTKIQCKMQYIIDQLEIKISKITMYFSATAERKNKSNSFTKREQRQDVRYT